MFKLTYKGLWAHKVRFALTGLAVVLGVAFMAGTMILTDTMEKTFDGLFATSNEGIDVVVQRTADVEGEWVEARERVDAGALDRISQLDGVASVAGSVEGFAQLERADGTTASTDGLGATLGAAWIADDELNPFALAAGHEPGAGEVVLDKHTIDDQGWSLGDTVTVFGNDGPVELALVGSATFGEVDGIPGSSLVAVDTATAQSMFGQPGAFDSIVVAGDGSMSNDDLAASITTTLDDSSLEVMTGEADTAEAQSDFKDDIGFFSTFLMSFAYIALFVGMFIIHNTFSIIVAQRQKEMALLRAIGAKRRQVLRSVLLESALVGAFASGVGLVAGIGISYMLRGLLTSVGLEIPGGEIVLSSGTITTAFVVGTVVTVLSSYLPARKASRIPPIAAMRDVALDRSGSSLTRTIAGLVVSGVGVTAFAAGMVADEASTGVQLLGIGALLVILGVFVLGPVLARPLTHVLGAFVPKISGTAGHLARENAKRNPRRTAATASALMIGVALVGFITIFASSAKASVGDAVDTALRADYIIDSGSWGDGGFATTIEDDLAALPEVELLSPRRVAPVATEAGTTEVTGVDTAVIDDLFDIDVVEGAMPSVVDDGVAISRDYATDHGLVLGDPVTITFPATGDQPFTVQAIYADEMFGGGLIVDLPAYEANVTDQYDIQVYATVHDGVTAEAGGEAITAALAAWPNADVQDQAAFKESVTAEIDQMLNLIYGLLALAVIIALIGIANTLALSVHERTRELGLLRAVGMTRRQVRTAIRWESVLIALLGTAFGFAIAVGGSFGIITTLADEGFSAFVVPGAQLTVIVVLAAVAGVVAALGPARRAARLDVLKAIATT
jgi:putative ABC transport system permease protein